MRAVVFGAAGTDQGIATRLMANLLTNQTPLAQAIVAGLPSPTDAATAGVVGNQASVAAIQALTEPLVRTGLILGARHRADGSRPSLCGSCRWNVAAIALLSHALDQQ